MTKQIEAIIKEAKDFGSCYIGSYAEGFAERTNKMVEKIERYAMANWIETEYVMNGTDCYIKVR